MLDKVRENAQILQRVATKLLKIKLLLSKILLLLKILVLFIKLITTKTAPLPMISSLKVQ
jgi:hypothetical protein